MSAKDNNESRLSMLERAEQLLAEGRIEEALDTLSAVEPDVGNRARLAYDYGVASVLLGFPDKADRFFTLPITEGYNIPGSLVWLGKAYEQQGDGNAAEEMYLSAVDEAGEDFLIPNKVLCDYYYRNAMYIKAERCAHRAAECDPADYYGIHMLVRIHQKRDMLREAEELLMSREEAFGDYPGYWYDRVENLELQGRYYPAIQLLETEPRIARIMPEEMMRLKLKLYLRRMQRDEARMMLQQLADNYHDTDATFFDMMFALAEGKLERAQALAERLIADNRDEEGLVVHTARLMRVFILANTIEAEEFDRQKTALKAESEACMAWFREQGYSIDLCGEALENLFNNRKADE